ncbi:alpha/beta fold hydrolase [Rhodobacter sp. Har01]|uniref:alpha/beta fold hydrolase n=1 Tax=Rhodobacter sp. Har01 TaxID=2883999 RepID=UPI001D0805E4|nr:alpha/beta fold hydrolase [Rhodobacter sp. Har01]MCB6178227.1 alpha/beta fold hydrolase [Rhodobacter sp. Har01]
MTEILLIHGSCHGAWCWHRVIPALAALGHSARAIDLPAHGNDRTPAAQATLDNYAQAILDALPRPALVVGHSAGGYAITAAAERDPARIAGLLYLCAYAPASGQSLAEMRRAGPRQPLAPAIRVSADRSAFAFDPAQTEALFYHDCPPEDRALAAHHLCPEPLRPQETPLTLTKRSQSLPRFYIRCSEDRAIPPEYQAVMAQSVPPGNRFTLPTSHSPFFAAPRALAEILDRIAQGAFGASPA